MSKPKPAPYSPFVPPRFKIEPLDYLLIAVPVSIGLHLADAPAVAVFLVSCLAVIPLAGLMGRATENLAETLGAGIGGLLNATFGNAAELIIALLALHKGLFGVVKASITGSILGNILLVFGASALAGGIKHKHLKFNRRAVQTSTT